MNMLQQGYFMVINSDKYKYTSSESIKTYLLYAYEVFVHFIRTDVLGTKKKPTGHR